jgi:hypothetical protein
MANGVFSGDPAQIFPINETITSIVLFGSLTSGLILPSGTALSVTAQLFTAPHGSNVFTAVPGATVVGAPALTGVLPEGTTFTGQANSLSIPVTSQSRGLIVISVSAPGGLGIQSVNANFGVSLTATG